MLPFKVSKSVHIEFIALFEFPITFLLERGATPFTFCAYPQYAFVDEKISSIKLVSIFSSILKSDEQAYVTKDYI